MREPSAHTGPHQGDAPLLTGSRVTALSYDSDGAPVGGQNIPFGMTLQVFGALIRASRVSEVCGRTLGDIIDLLARNEGSQNTTCDVAGPESVTRYEIDITSRGDGVVDVVLFDITARHGERRSIETLALELAHRTKNVLAVVLSLATQTARRTDNYENFKDRFLGHVTALSSAHDMIAVTGWLGAPLATIAETCVDPSDQRLTSDIPGALGLILLKPNAVQNMAMIFCELTAACVCSDEIAYRINERDDGQLDFIWSCRGSHDSDRIWTEMLCRYAPIALDGDGMIDYSDEGFDYHLTIGVAQRV